MVLAAAIGYLALFAFLTSRAPKLSVALLLALLPTYGIRFRLFGVPATLLELTIWVIAATWFVRMWREHGPPPRPSLKKATSERNPFHPFVWPVVLWLVVATAAILISPNLTAALGLWKAYFVEPLLVFVLVVMVFRGQPERHWVLDALGATVVAMSVLALYQALSGQLLPEPWASTMPRRMTSWYSYPNAVGLFVAPVVAMAATAFLWHLAVNRRDIGRLFWLVAVATLGTVAAGLSVTKGAWAGIVAGVLVGALTIVQRKRRVVTVAALLLIIILLAAPNVAQRLTEEVTLRSPSGLMRRVVWEETGAFLKDHPLTGAGLAGYQTALEPYHDPWRPEVSPYKLEIFLYPHNVFLNFWSELGLGGLLVFSWILIVFFRLAWRQRYQPLSAAALAGLVALVVHGLVDVPYFKNDLAVLFWVIVAMPLLERGEVSLPASKTV